MQDNTRQRSGLQIYIISSTIAVLVSGYIIYRAYSIPGTENASYYLLVLALLSSLFFLSLSVIGAYESRRGLHGLIALIVTMTCFLFAASITFLGLVGASDFLPADSALVAGLAISYCLFLLFRQITLRKQKVDTVIASVIWTMLFLTLMLVTLPFVATDSATSNEVKDAVTFRIITFSQALFIAVHIISGTSYVKFAKEISLKYGKKLETVKFFKGTAFDGNMWVQVYASFFMLPIATALMLSYLILSIMSK